MDETRRARREARRRQRERRTAGCCGLIALAAVLLAAYGIARTVGFFDRFQWPDFLSPDPRPALEFRMEDGYLTCTTVPTRRGIDVSEYQEDIDWEQVRGAGFDFAFIRIGYRGNSTGDIYPDDLARQNLAGAKAAGLDVGVYFYAQAVSPEEAAEEARWCLDFLAGETLDLPVVYDWEWVGGSARTANMDRETLTQCVKTFCDTVEGAGYRGMVYFNNHVSRDLLELSELQSYPWWLAQYKDQLDYPHQVDFWQYTEEGTVPGIKGDVDIDLMFLHD